MAKRAGKTRPGLSATDYRPDPAARIVVFYGPDAFQRADCTAALRAAIANAHGEVETIYADGQTAHPADVLDECRSFGLMQQHKLVVVDAADQFVKEDSRPIVERYAAAPSDSATLVLRAERWTPGRLGGIIEQQGGVTVKCDGLPERDAPKWAVERANTVHGCKLDKRAAEKLVELLGADPGRIDSELAKLALSIDEGGAITAQSVTELVGCTREEIAWNIQAPLLSGDPEAALATLRIVLENAPRDADVPVQWAMLDLARKLHGASRGFAQRIPVGEMLGTLRIWGESRDPILNTARRLSPSDAADLLHECIDATAKARSGSNPRRLLEGLAIRFASLSR